MAAKTSVCDICYLRHVTSPSTHWCPECEDALCSDCSERHSLSKGTRGHKTITFSQYQALPTFITDIQQFCIYHKEKYQQYCIKHECPICYKCIKEHGKCIEVVPLEEVVNQVKTSELFRDLEQSLDDVLENIKRFREDRENNVKTIKDQKKTIAIEIDRIKTQINNHLDILKEGFIKELDQVFQNYDENINSIIHSLKEQEKEIEHCSMEVENLKKYASDFQTFIGMREIQPKVIENEIRLKSMIENKSLENVDIEFAIDDKIHNILLSVTKVGSVFIKKSPSVITIKPSKKTGQAQLTLPKSIQSISEISVDFIKKMETNCERVKGCFITRVGGFLLIDVSTFNLKLVALNAQGETEYIIQLPSTYSTAFDVDCINLNTVAIPISTSHKSGQLHGISIVDITMRKEIKFIDLPCQPYGIAHDSSTLVCCVEDQDMHLISCTDYSITKIPNTVLPRSSYVSMHADKILFTNSIKNTVYCRLHDGTPIWEFTDEFVLQTPRGITVDDQGTVFVIGRDTCNVLVISSDGKQCKQILNKENGINEPNSICFEKLRNQVLVINAATDAYLYNISFF